MMTVCLSEYFTDAATSGLLSGQWASKNARESLWHFFGKEETDFSACESKQEE